MADKKISALTAATTPLTGTEVLPIVQSGATKKVSVSNLSAGRSISASGINLSGLTASTAVALDANKDAISVTNTGTGNNVLASSPSITSPTFATDTTHSYLTASSAVATDANKKLVSVTNTGSGNNVLSATPVIINHRVTNINDIFLDGYHTGGTINNNATVDFANFSGVLFVTNWGIGTTGIWLCGGGAVASLSAAVGSLAYNAGINGYTWTNDTGTAYQFGFINFKTRNGA